MTKRIKKPKARFRRPAPPTREVITIATEPPRELPPNFMRQVIGRTFRDGQPASHVRVNPLIHSCTWRPAPADFNDQPRFVYTGRGVFVGEAFLFAERVMNPRYAKWRPCS